jgi:hypothetical protein
MDVRLPDGTVIQNVPEGTTKADLVAKLQRNGMAVPSEWLAQSAAPAEGSSIANYVNGVGRAAGLTARAGLEGLPAVADIAWNPVRKGLSWATGTQPLPSMEDGGRTIANLLGLPAPQSADERAAQSGAKMMASAGGSVGVAQQLAKRAPGLLQMMGEQFSAQPAVQLAGAGAGGVSGESAKQGGASPWGQFGAALAGTMGGAVGAQKLAQAGRGVFDALRSLRAPAVNIDVTLERELGKAGIDWAALSNQAKEQLRKDAGQFVVGGKPLDTQALGRLADFRQVPGSVPLLGDVTRNLAKQQANQTGLFGAADLADTTNTNAKSVLASLGGVAKSPQDSVQTGQGLLSMALGKDAALQGAENALYKAARDAAGRDIPLARGAFVEEAFGNLAKSNKTAFLPENVGTLLNQIAAGEVKVGGKVHQVPFNVDTIDSLKTTLAAASRSADGNGRAAIKAVRDALENVGIEPIKRDMGGQQAVTEAGAKFLQGQDALPKAALAAFDAARGAARQRRMWQESAPWIEDALSGADPIGFVRKHVVNGPLQGLQSMRQEIGTNDAMLQAVRKQMLDYIMKRGSADVSHTNFSSKGMQDAFESLTPQRMELFFGPEEIQQIKAAINVGRHIQAQPMGSAVNNSNTAATVLGRLSDVLTRGAGLPVVDWAATPLLRTVSGLQMRQMGNVGRGLLAPSAPAPGLPMPGLLTSPLLFAPPGPQGQ